MVRLSPYIIACGLWMLASMQSASAQAPSPVIDASRRVESIPVKPAVTTMRSDVTLDSSGGTEFESFAPRSAADNDIGEQLLLRQKDKVETLFFSADSFVFWTDNAAHVSAGELEDSFWGWHAGADWQPHLTNKLTMPIGISESAFQYNEFDALNFEVFEVTAGLAYTEPALANVMFFTQYQFERLTHDFDELLNSHSVRAGAQKIWLLNRRNSIQVIAYGDWDVDTDVDALKRNEYIASAVWRFKLTRKVELALGYRYTYLDYSEVPRHDHLHLIDLNVTYTPTKWLQLYASAAYGINNSNIEVYDYEAATLGVGIGLRLRF